jgi:hypothetical protein
VGYSPRRSVEESIRREHLILARIKGELYPCAGAPMRTSGEWRLSDTLGKHRRVPYSFTLKQLLSSITFVACLYSRIAMLESELEFRVQNFLSVESLGTFLGTRGESWVSTV